MVAGRTHPARRIPIPASGNPDDVIFDLEPGDYCGPIQVGTERTLWFVLPDDEHGIRRITEPPWVFAEQGDGSLEVRESIKTHADPPWHGYLDAGNSWREVE